MSRQENDRKIDLSLLHFFLELQSAHLRHTDIQNHTSREERIVFLQEILVLNLLRNAADAVEPLKDKSLIKLSVASEDGNWVLSITDNGPSVPDEVLERMKKALQNSLKADGLGLGLKIVFAIAERHRVELNFSRVDPKGLRAEIRFKKVSQ